MRNAIELLTTLRARTDWAVISAERATLSEEENAGRTEGLRSYLTRLGLNPRPVEGIYGGTRETSFLVFHTVPEVAIRIGAAFDQESVLTARGLEYCDGSGFLPSAGLYVGTDPLNASTVRADDGTRLRFVSDIRWDSDRRIA